MRGPEEALTPPHPQALDDRGDAEPLPGRPELGVALEVILGADAEQGMQESGVRKINLGRFHLALAQVLVPWRQDPYHERRREEIEIAAHGHVRDPKRACKLRSIPDLAVIVREHRPEALQRRRSDGDAELRQVTLDKGTYEIVPPFEAPRVRSGKE